MIQAQRTQYVYLGDPFEILAGFPLFAVAEIGLFDGKMLSWARVGILCEDF